MLVLNNIVKHYYAAGKTVEALKGISISFRKKEFVSILGHSGCGKTTLLNIIGGLDQYTSGDLVIGGKSTKSFKDHDWDVYRNHRIGFIFQTYNLIPHQTVLGNVELALTIAGVSKKKRIETAKKVLDKVGLAGEYYKRPNQLSGGQQQRVAIARALVNDPEILLADEPTGALDSQTSVQIMELIKEIAKDRLVIMVTHNPELAEKYSSRIVRLLDGKLIEDSDPYTREEEAKERDEAVDSTQQTAEKQKKENAKMTLLTTFRLSSRNLISKFKRTVMVIIAGSIGIIGVSAVLSISTGVRDYIESFQDDMLSGNPIAIEETGFDYSSLSSTSSMRTQYEALKEGDWVNVNPIIGYLVSNEDALENMFFKNEFDFNYVNYVKSMPKEYYKEIMLDYGIETLPNIYTEFRAFNSPDAEYEKYTKTMSIHAITETYRAILEQTAYSAYASYITNLTTAFTQGISDNDYILEQYDVLAGELPKKANDIIVVLSSDDRLNDLLLAQLGYYSEEEFYNLIYKYSPDYMEGEYNKDIDKTSFTYDEILGKKFTWYPNDTIYENKSLAFANSFYHIYNYNYEADESWDNGIELNISCIITPKDGLSYGTLQSGFIYTEDLARLMISRNFDSEIAENIRNHGSVQSFALQKELAAMYGISSLGISYELEYVFSNDGSRTFVQADGGDSDGHIEKKTVFIGKSDSGIMSTFVSYMGSAGGTATSSASDGMLSALANAKTMDINAVGGTYLPVSISVYPNNFETKYLVTDYLSAWNSDGTTIMAKSSSPNLSKTAMIGAIKNSGGKYKFIELNISTVSENVTLEAIGIKGNGDVIWFSDGVIKDYDGNVIPADTAVTVNGIKVRIDVEASGLANSDKLEIYAGKEGLSGAVSVTAKGITDKSETSVTFFNYKEDLSDFGSEDVEKITLTSDNRSEVKYTDSVELVINMMNSIINIVTYALIVFTALSLVVSTVMVGIITYVSVVERVKEIGVIRSLGGRRKDVSALFVAETFVIGLSSGVFGVAVTWLLGSLGNTIVKAVSDGSVARIAHLTWQNAVIMIVISVVLTLISGLIPARSAARKNPVEALRTE